MEERIFHYRSDLGCHTYTHTHTHTRRHTRTNTELKGSWPLVSSPSFHLLTTTVSLWFISSYWLSVCSLSVCLSTLPPEEICSQKSVFSLLRDFWGEFFPIRSEGLWTEGVVCCADCKDPWGKLGFVILGYINKTDLTWFGYFCATYHMRFSHLHAHGKMLKFC